MLNVFVSCVCNRTRREREKNNQQTDKKQQLQHNSTTELSRFVLGNNKKRRRECQCLDVSFYAPSWQRIRCIYTQIVLFRVCYMFCRVTVAPKMSAVLFCRSLNYLHLKHFGLQLKNIRKYMHAGIVGKRWRKKLNEHDICRKPEQQSVHMGSTFTISEWFVFFFFFLSLSFALSLLVPFFAIFSSFICVFISYTLQTHWIRCRNYYIISL